MIDLSSNHQIDQNCVICIKGFFMYRDNGKLYIYINDNKFQQIIASYAYILGSKICIK